MRNKYLSIKCSLCVRLSIFIKCNDHQIRSRSIAWRRIAVFPTKVIFDTMVDIVIWINNNLGCFFPNLPAAIGNCSCKYLTAFINTYIVRSWLLSWINWSKEVQDICGWFGPCKFCPCFHHSARSTYRLNTIISARTEVVLYWGWVCTWIIMPLRIWLVLGSPVQSDLLSIFGKTGTGTGLYRLMDHKKPDWTDVNQFSTVIVSFWWLTDRSWLVTVSTSQ